MTDISQALLDVRWLAQRLKGLIALSEDIESYDNLKKQASELQKVIDSKKSEYQSVDEKVQAIQQQLEYTVGKHEDLKRTQRTSLDSMLAKANSDAQSIFEKAKAEAAQLRATVEAERQAYQKKNKDLEDLSLSLTKEVNAKKQQLEELNASIASLKAKF